MVVVCVVLSWCPFSVEVLCTVTPSLKHSPPPSIVHVAPDNRGDFSGPWLPSTVVMTDFKNMSSLYFAAQLWYIYVYIMLLWFCEEAQYAYNIIFTAVCIVAYKCIMHHCIYKQISWKCSNYKEQEWKWGNLTMETVFVLWHKYKVSLSVWTENGTAVSWLYADCCE